MTALLPFALLLALAPVARAEMLDPNPTEAANLNLVMANLSQLVADLETYGRDGGLGVSADEARQVKERLQHVLENLRSKIANKQIKVVRGMARGSPRKYKFQGETSTPLGAYCVLDTQVWNKATRRWERCQEGTILLDSDLLDNPEARREDRKADGSYDEHTRRGWKAKWELLDVLVHEKNHEVMIAEQLKRLPPNATPAQHDAAIMRGINADCHAQVYTAQKEVVDAERAVLQAARRAREAELQRLRDERSSKRRELSRARGDARDRLRQEIADLDRRIEELERSLKEGRADYNARRAQLEDRHRHLQLMMQRAVHGTELNAHHHCEALYGDLATGHVSLALSFPSGFERVELTLEDRVVIDARISEYQYFGVSGTMSNAPFQVDRYVSMPVSDYTSLAALPDPCTWVAGALERGEIVAGAEPVGVLATPRAPGAHEAEMEQVGRLEDQLSALERERADLEGQLATCVSEGCATAPSAPTRSGALAGALALLGLVWRGRRRG